jgi:hypothetical protein
MAEAREGAPSHKNLWSMSLNSTTLLVEEDSTPSAVGVAAAERDLGESPEVTSQMVLSALNSLA